MSVTHQETDITWRYVDRRAAAINARATTPLWKPSSITLPTI